jgi:hypothetical protein
VRESPNVEPDFGGGSHIQSQQYCLVKDESVSYQEPDCVREAKKYLENSASKKSLKRDLLQGKQVNPFKRAITETGETNCLRQSMQNTLSCIRKLRNENEALSGQAPICSSKESET